MNIRPLRNILILLSLFALSPTATRAADVLQHVPNDALGFIVIKNLASTDAKGEQLLKSLRVKFPSPLTLFTSATGLNDGLDLKGDALFAILPGADAAKPQFGVWLPLRNYDQFLTSLEARQRDGIVAVIVAGEDILVARHDEWVLLMDPDQRERMEQLLAARPNPPTAVAEWQAWIDANGIAAVALPGGIRAIVAWAAESKPPSGNENERGENAEDIFGQAAEDEDPFVAPPADGRSSDSMIGIMRGAVHDWIAKSPKFARAISNAEAVGCAARLDDAGHALVGMRLNFHDKQQQAAHGNIATEMPPALYRGGSFVMNGAGTLAHPLKKIAAEVFVRNAVNDLQSEQRLDLDDKVIARFQQALENSLANLNSVAVLSQPGEKAEGIYTNDYLLVHVESADDFIVRADDVLRLWNTMNREAEGASPLIFDVEEQKVGGRAATQYSLDVAGAEGLAIPEVRQAMEKFFGPGGKMNLWIVPVDDKNVLLATATQREVASTLEMLDRKQPISWDHSEFGVAYGLLPREADWRLFFNPGAYAQWHRRMRDAMTGPVVGGRPRKDFPASPPVGFVGGVRNDELWIDAAVPADTIRSAGAYLK